MHSYILFSISLSCLGRDFINSLCALPVVQQVQEVLVVPPHRIPSPAPHPPLLLLSPPHDQARSRQGQLNGGLTDMLSFPAVRIMYTNVMALTGSLFQTPGGGGNKGGGGGVSRQQGSNLFKISFGSRSKRINHKTNQTRQRDINNNQ